MNNRKKASFGTVFSVVLSMAMGICLGFFMFSEEHSSLVDFLVFTVALIIAFSLELVIHEAGHLVCGLLTGYKFVSFRIGSFVLTKTPQGLKIKKLSIPGTGGQCLLDPPPYDGGNYPCTLYNAGGVLFNVLSAVIFWLLSTLPLGSIMVRIFRCTAVIGIYLALQNGIPLLTGTVANDGHNILYLNKNKTAKLGLWQSLKINKAANDGIRVKDMPAEWFVKGDIADMKDGLGTGTLVALAGRYLDEHDFDRAREIYDLIRDQKLPLAGLHETMIMNDCVYLDILKKGAEADVSALKQKPHKQVLAQMNGFPSVLRTRYAVAKVVEKDEAKAAEIRREFEKAASSYPMEAEVESERELMDLL